MKLTGCNLQKAILRFNNLIEENIIKDNKNGTYNINL
jgi:hypothetical protein